MYECLFVRSFVCLYVCIYIYIIVLYISYNIQISVYVIKCIYYRYFMMYIYIIYICSSRFDNSTLLAGGQPLFRARPFGDLIEVVSQPLQTGIVLAKATTTRCELDSNPHMYRSVTALPETSLILSTGLIRVHTLLVEIC